MKIRNTIIKELKQLVEKENFTSNMKVSVSEEDFSNETIELMQKASKSNVGYAWKIVPMNINGKKSLGIEIRRASEVGTSFDGDKVSGYSSFSSKITVPVYEKDRLELEKGNTKKRNQKFTNLERIGKEYFDNGILPLEVSGWKEHLNNGLDSSLTEKLEKLIGAISESNVMELNNENAAIFLEEYIDEFLKEENKIEKVNENYDNAYKASLIRDRANNIATKYFKSGWPSEYSIETSLKDPSIPTELKEKMKEIASMSSKVSGLPLEKFWFKLEPLINEFYNLEAEMMKSKNETLKKTKENYQKKSLLERIKEKIKEKIKGKNKDQNGSIKM